MQAGWYPTGQDALRWWDGERWTEHVVYPVPQVQPTSRMYRLSVALLTIGVIAFFASGLASMGDPGPSTRAGVTRQSDVMMVVPLLCPRERLTAITLKTLNGTTLWRSEGGTLDTSSFPLGAPPTGFHDTVEFVQPGAAEAVELVIDSSEVGRTYIDFTAGQIPEGSYFGPDGVSRTRTELEHRAEVDTPCGDPHGDRLQNRIVTTGWLVTLSFVVAGLALMRVDNRRRRRAG